MLFPSALRAKLQEKNKNDSHHQKSPPSVETDTAITWEASLQSAHLALTVKAVDVLCVCPCMQSCMCACTLGTVLLLHELGHKCNKAAATISQVHTKF